MDRQKTPGGDWEFVPAMFVRPRRTIDAIVDGERYDWVIGLAAIGGIVDALAQVSGRQADVGLSMMAMMAAVVIGGLVGGIVMLYLTGWLTAMTGRWLGGSASAEELRAALAWGRVPLLLVGVIYLVKFCLLGDQALADEVTLHLAPRVMLTAAALDLLASVFAIWSIVTTLAAVSAVQRFSAAKAVANLLLAGLVAGVALLVVILLVAVVRQ